MKVNIIMNDLKDGTCNNASDFDQVIFCGIKDNCPEYPPTLTLLEAESSDDDVNWLLWIGIGAAGLIVIIVIAVFIIKGSK